MFSGTPPTHLMWSSMFGPDKPKIAKSIDWRRIGKLFLPYVKQECALLLCICITSVLGLVPPILTMKIIDNAIAQKDFHLLVILVGAMVGVALVSGLVAVVQGFLNAVVGEGIMRDIRSNLVAHLHKMPLSFFTSTKTGEIMNRVANDVDNIDDVVTGTLVTIVGNLITIITTVVTIVVLDWRLALISLCIVPLMIIPLFPVGRRMYEIRKVTRKKRDEILALTEETLSISGITLVKSFVREGYERQRFYERGSELMELEVKLAMVGRWFITVIMSMVIVGPALVWLGGGWLAINYGLTVGTIVTFVALLGRLYTPAAALAGVQVQVVSALAVFERIFEYLDMEEEGKEKIDAVELTSVNGDVTFDSVSFSYIAERPTLKNISLDIKAGQMVALVGPSGAGKTTITNLLPRFYDVESGSILIDGQDIRDFKLASLRSHIGIVTQENYLFHETIKTNLSYARPQATDQEIEEAARAANMHEFIISLPEGYQTVVGQRGHKLSGGERQRLAIARVLLKDPRILILDEATSSLDSVNENLIQAALVPLMQGRTSLVIAHRLSTILAADRIFVIDDGQVKESGTHAELLAQSGLYTKLYREQFKNG